jgi:hypothetical protein
MPDEPKSFFEREPLRRGRTLAVLIFLLWVPMAVLVLGISALVEVNAILLGVFAIGTLFSIGLALAALRTSPGT